VLRHDFSSFCRYSGREPRQDAPTISTFSMNRPQLQPTQFAQ
jgi:hypothetical protein